jgi:hypothetical protein
MAIFFSRTPVRDRVPVAVAAVVVAIASIAASRSAHAARLWIAWDSSEVGTCRGLVEDYYSCVIGASNFNTLTSGFGGGETLTGIGGTAVITGCTAVDNCFDHAAFNATIQCVEDQTHFPLQPNDVVLFFPPMLSCSDGCNDHNLSINTPTGTVPIHGAFAFTGGSCNCQTALGFHEVYEATGNATSADACNHTTNAGWYTLNGCDGTMFRSQLVSPPGSAACDMLTVDSTALCAQTRDVRTRGMCMGGNLVTCALGPTVDDCQGMGCDPSPTPHCVTFSAQCSLMYPMTMCSGAVGDATVTCMNTGMRAWDANLQIGVQPPDRDSLFADPSWISPRIAAAVSPASVAPMTSGAFHFRLQAPTVTGPIQYTQSFGLLEAGGMYYSSPSDLAMHITVAPCAPDAGSGDASAHDASGDGPPNGAVAVGCGCRAAGSRNVSPWIAFASLAMVVVRRRRSRRSM